MQLPLTNGRVLVNAVGTWALGQSFGASSYSWTIGSNTLPPHRHAAAVQDFGHTHGYSDNALGGPGTAVLAQGTVFGAGDNARNTAGPNPENPPGYPFSGVPNVSGVYLMDTVDPINGVNRTAPAFGNASGGQDATTVYVTQPSIGCYFAIKL